MEDKDFDYVKAYIHGSKESFINRGKEHGLSSRQIEQFMYAGYEHEIIYKVDKEGNATAWKIDGRLIEEPTQ